jgi:hypothetical protein
MNIRYSFLIFLFFFTFSCVSSNSDKKVDGLNQRVENKFFDRLLEITNEDDLRDSNYLKETYRFWVHRGHGIGFITLATIDFEAAKIKIVEYSIFKDDSSLIQIDSVITKGSFLISKNDSIYLRNLIRDSNLLSLKERDSFEENYLDGEYWKIEAKGVWNPNLNRKSNNYFTVERKKLYGHLKELCYFVVKGPTK